MVMADTSPEFQEENEITKFGDNIGVGQFFSVQAKILLFPTPFGHFQFLSSAGQNPKLILTLCTVFRSVF